MIVSWIQIKKAYLLHTLQVRACGEVRLIQSVHTQVLVAKQAGRIEHVSSSGMANHPVEARLNDICVVGCDGTGCTEL